MEIREKLIGWIQAAVGGCASYWAGKIADYLIANDVEPVVRCKECKYSRKTGRDGYLFCNTSLGMGRGVIDTDFCSEGKRRTE